MIDLLRKGAANLLGIWPNDFDNLIDDAIHEADNLLTKEAAAYLVMDKLGLRVSSHAMSSDKNAAVFTVLINRKQESIKPNDSQSKEEEP